MRRLLAGAGLAALLAIAGLCLALRVQGRRLDAARGALAQSQAMHAADTAAMRAAQAKADADWRAEIARVATLNRRLKDDADRQGAAAALVYRERVLRIPSAGADRGVAGGPAALPAAAAAARADRSGDDPLLLARADALICAANTARLQAAHDWAMAVLAGE